MLYYLFSKHLLTLLGNWDIVQNKNSYNKERNEQILSLTVYTMQLMSVRKIDNGWN